MFALASSFGRGTHTACKMMNDAVVTATTEKIPFQHNYFDKGCVILEPRSVTVDSMILQFRVCGPKGEREGGRRRRGCNPAVSNPGWSDRDKGGKEQKLLADGLPACMPEGRSTPIIKLYLTMTMQFCPYNL